MILSFDSICIKCILLILVSTIPTHSCKYNHNQRLRRGIKSAVNLTTDEPIRNQTNHRLKPIQLIIGGSSASLGEFPWQGMVNWVNRGGTPMLCGCTLIGRRYALTAGHCAADMVVSKSYVIFGATDLYDTKGGVYISKAYVHPKYVSTNYDVQNDIAILKLDDSVSYNKYIKPITIPVDDTNMTIGTGIISGWGYYYNPKTGQIVKHLSSTLQKAEISFISRPKCMQIWHDLATSQICAGNKLKGTASGDSGGPLQVYYNNTWYQVGITSYGGVEDDQVLNQAKYSGVYSRVSSYCSWIEKTTGGDVKCDTTSVFGDARRSTMGLFLHKNLIFVSGLFYFLTKFT